MMKIKKMFIVIFIIFIFNSPVARAYYFDFGIYYDQFTDSLKSFFGFENNFKIDDNLYLHTKFNTDFDERNYLWFNLDYSNYNSGFNSIYIPPVNLAPVNSIPNVNLAPINIGNSNSNNVNKSTNTINTKRPNVNLNDAKPTIIAPQEVKLDTVKLEPIYINSSSDYVKQNASKTFDNPNDDRNTSVANMRCFITAFPLVVKSGGSVVLQWESSGASEAFISPQLGKVSSSGQKQIKNLKADTKFTLTLKSGTTIKTCSVLVQVKKPVTDTQIIDTQQVLPSNTVQTNSVLNYNSLFVDPNKILRSGFENQNLQAQNTGANNASLKGNNGLASFPNSNNFSNLSNQQGNALRNEIYNQELSVIGGQIKGMQANYENNNLPSGNVLATKGSASVSQGTDVREEFYANGTVIVSSIPYTGPYDDFAEFVFILIVFLLTLSISFYVLYKSTWAVLKTTRI